jgi:hypothetical protein
MAFFDSQVSVFNITDTGASDRNITPYVVSVDGLPGPRELSDASVLGDTGRKWQPSLENVVITLELLWSDDALVGSDTVLGPLRTHTAAVAFKYGPKGSTAGYVKYSGSAWVRDYRILSRVGNMVTSRCELQVNGAVTRGTYP